MYAGNTKQNILTPIKSGAKILTGTRTVLTNQARNTVNNVKRVANSAIAQIDPNGISDRDKIAEKALIIIKESMYKPPEMMGHGATMVRNVVNPYNSKVKSKSIVDQKARFRTKNNVYPKVKVDNSAMDKRVRKVRTYLYKVNGQPVASKIEHTPQQSYNPV